MDLDQVCDDFANAGAKLLVQELDDGGYILIQGDKTGLRFLAQALLAIAEEPDSEFQIGPNGAGRIFFDALSTRGLYLRRGG